MLLAIEDASYVCEALFKKCSLSQRLPAGALGGVEATAPLVTRVTVARQRVEVEQGKA